MIGRGPSGATPVGADDPIEQYLDRILRTLPGSPRTVRHTLIEIEAHLVEAAEAQQATGLEEQAARAEAVRRMGPVTALTEPTSVRRVMTSALRRRVTLGCLLIGGIAGVAAGIGGLLSRFAQTLWGNRAIGVPFPSGSYSPADCARWQAGYPSARNCVTAMTADHADDFLRNAFGAGVLGVLALVAFTLLRRRWASPAIAAALPRSSENLIGAVLATGATLLLTGQGVDAIAVTHGNGAAQSLSLALGALLAAGFFAFRSRGVRYVR